MILPETGAPVHRDVHQIIIFSGDIVRMLREKGVNCRQNMLSWLNSFQV